MVTTWQKEMLLLFSCQTKRIIVLHKNGVKKAFIRVLIQPTDGIYIGGEVVLVNQHAVHTININFGQQPFVYATDNGDGTVTLKDTSPNMMRLVEGASADSTKHLMVFLN